MDTIQSTTTPCSKTPAPHAGNGTALGAKPELRFGGEGGLMATAPETPPAASDPAFNLDRPIDAALAGLEALQDLTDEPIGEHSQRAVVELVASIMGEINTLRAQFKTIAEAAYARAAGAPAASAAETPAAIADLVFDLDDPITAGTAAAQALQDLLETPPAPEAHRAMYELISSIMGALNRLRAQHTALFKATRTPAQKRTHAAAAGAGPGGDSPERNIEILVRDYFVTREQYEFACGDPVTGDGPLAEGDAHWEVADACMAAQPASIDGCKALLRVICDLVERLWGLGGWHGTVIHLLKTLHRELLALDHGDLESIMLAADGPDPRASVKIGIAMDILARLGSGEPYLVRSRELLGRIKTVVATAEDRAAKMKAAA